MPGTFGMAREALRRIRRQRDRWLKAHGSDQCGRGCSACCKQPVGTLIVEGVGIAAGLDRMEALAMAQAVTTEADRGIEHGRPCLFLDGSGGCSIYDRRPIVCATLFPNGTCTPGQTKQIDCREPVWAARDLDMNFCRRIAFPYPGPLLLPAAVLVGLELLAGRRPAVAPEWQTMSEAKLALLKGVA